MKKLVIMFLFVATIIGCDKEERITCCDVSDPATELPWLAQIIELAETDSTGHYYGTIYLERYKERDVIFVDMMMGMSGLAGHWFNCDGTRVEMNETEGDIARAKKDKIIYTNK